MRWRASFGARVWSWRGSSRHVRLPEDERAEILAGVVETLPAPRPRHSNVQRSLGRFVGGPFHDDDGFGGPGGWWIFVEVDVQLSPHGIVRPDLSGWRRDRLPVPDARPITIAPDWACEIFGGSSRATSKSNRSIIADAAPGSTAVHCTNAALRTEELRRLPGPRPRRRSPLTNAPLPPDARAARLARQGVASHCESPPRIWQA